MEHPQEPAWLRSYKTRATPFSTRSTKATDNTSVLPSVKQIEEQSSAKTPTQELASNTESNAFSIAFPSIISLGLGSFNQEGPATSLSVVHPALTEEHKSSETQKATSDSSSSIGREEKDYARSASEKCSNRSHTGLTAVLKRWIRTLGCIGV